MLALSIDAKKVMVIDFQYCGYLCTTVPKIITELLCSYIDLHKKQIWSVWVDVVKRLNYTSQSEV